MQRKTEKQTTKRGWKSDAARYDCKHNVLRLHFRHVKLPNITRRIWQKIVPILTTFDVLSTLSLRRDSKSDFATR